MWIVIFMSLLTCFIAVQFRSLDKALMDFHRVVPEPLLSLRLESPFCWVVNHHMLWTPQFTIKMVLGIGEQSFVSENHVN